MQNSGHQQLGRVPIDESFVERDRERRAAQAAREAEANALDREFVERKQRERAETFAKDVGAKYAKCSLENFEIYHQNQTPVIEKLREVRDNLETIIDERKNILLYGSAGTGKDHIKAALLSRVDAIRYERQKQGQAWWLTIESVSGQEILESSFRLNCSARMIVSLSDPINPCGTQPDWQICKLFNFIDDCYRVRTMLWVSMNAADLDEVEQRLSTPLYERIVENAIVVECLWPSYRTKGMPEVIGAKKGKQ